MTKCKRVYAIVVLYKPEFEATLLRLQSIAPQVEKVLLMDNGGGRYAVDFLKGAFTAKMQYIDMEGNQGIAVAQNKGIALARSAGASHVLLLDQDTTLPERYVSSCLQIEAGLLEQGVSVGTIAACYYQQQSTSSRTYQEVDYVIASGQLIQMTVLARVGDMHAPLFLDAVDDEWSARARYYGYHLFLNTQVLIRHELGYPRKILKGLLSLRYHSPFRYYYMFRNYHFLIQQKYLPWRLKLHYVKRLLKLTVKALLVSERRQYWVEIKRGLADTNKIPGVPLCQ